jgi:hypothetical protein
VLTLGLDPDHLLVHVDPGDARMDDIRHTSSSPRTTGKARAARRARNKIKILYPALTAAIRGTYQAASVHLSDRHIAPRCDDVSRGTPSFTHMRASRQ